MSLSIGQLVGFVDLDTEAAEKAGDRLSGVFSGFKSSWGKVLGGVGVAAGGVFATSLVGAMNLEPGRDKIAASLDLSTKQADRAGKVAGKVYADGWGESSAEVNDAIEAVMSSIKGMRNASERDLHATTQAALTFAQTMGVDVSKAAQVAGNMVNNGMAKNGMEAFDLLTKASSRVPKELREDVLDASDEYGQFFHTLGIKGPQAMELLVRGSQKGMYGIDKTGDAIKEFTIRSTDMSTTTKQAYKAIGLDAHTMANDVLAGGNRAHKAFDKVVRGVLAIQDPTKRSNTAIKLFGTQMEDMSVGDVPKFLKGLVSSKKGLDDWRGSTERAGKTLSDNAVNNIETFKRHLQVGFVNMIGGHVLPLVTEWSGVLDTGLGPALHMVGNVLSKVTGFLDKHHTTARLLVGVLGALVAVTLVHEAAMAVSAAGGMVAWLKGTKLVTAATKVQTAVQWALNAAMDANPITLIVLALAALAVGLVIAYKKSETFRRIVHAALHGVEAAAKSVGNFFAHTVPEFFEHAWSKAKSITTSGADKVVGFVKGLPGRMGRALGDLVKLYTLPYRLAGAAALDVIRDKGGAVVDWVKGIPGKLRNLGSLFGSAGRWLLQDFINGMRTASGIIKGIAGNVWNTVKGLLNGAIDKINAALEFRISLPLGKSITINPPDIQHLRTGGRVGANRPQMAWIGDANEPESVLRDSQLRTLLEAAVAAATRPQPSHDGPLIGQVVQQPGESASAFAERLWFITRKRG